MPLFRKLSNLEKETIRHQKAKDKLEKKKLNAKTDAKIHKIDNLIEREKSRHEDNNNEIRKNMYNK